MYIADCESVTTVVYKEFFLLKSCIKYDGIYKPRTINASIAFQKYSDKLVINVFNRALLPTNKSVCAPEFNEFE